MTPIKRRLPDFSKEIADLKFLLEGKKIDDMKSRANKLMFYDNKESPDDFLKKVGSYDQILLKRLDLGKLQETIRLLETKIDNSDDQQFLETVYNQITSCNQDRNRSLEQIDDRKETIEWYIPNVLSQDNFEDYKKTLDDLALDKAPGAGCIAGAEMAPKKKGKLRSLLSKKKSAV